MCPPPWFLEHKNSLVGIGLTDQSTYCFYLRARKTQAEIRKTDIELRINEKGEEFLALTTDFRTKIIKAGSATVKHSREWAGSSRLARSRP